MKDDPTKTMIKMGQDVIVNVDGDDEEENDEICSARRCLQPTGDDINWVQCDKCEKWFHLFCIGELVFLLGLFPRTTNSHEVKHCNFSSLTSSLDVTAKPHDAFLSKY